MIIQIKQSTQFHTFINSFSMPKNMKFHLRIIVTDLRKGPYSQIYP